MASWNKQNGQSALEVIIALALLIMTSTASFVVLTTVMSQQISAKRQETAQRLLEEGVEATRQIRNREWELLVPGTYGLALQADTWTFSGTSDVIDSTYTRTVVVASVGDDNQRQVTVNVTWPASQTRNDTLTVVTRMTNWFTTETWGNWGLPIVVGTIDIGPEGKASGVASNGTQVVVVAESSSGNKPSFFTVDAAIDTAPTIQSNATTTDDLRDVVEIEDGTIAYTTGTENDNELRVWDISDPYAPTQLAVRDLNADGWTMYIDGDRLYVAAVNGLHVFDISTPDSPVSLGSLSLGVDARGVAVAEPYAYVVTPHNDQELRIVDITDPATMSVVGTYNTNGSYDGLAVDVRGSRLYIGTAAAASTNPELYIMSRSNPIAPTLLSSIDIGGDLNAIKAAGAFVFLATGVSNQEFKIYRVTNGTSPTLEAGVNMAQVATDITFKDNTIYISLRSNDAFQIVQPSQ